MSVAYIEKSIESSLLALGIKPNEYVIEAVEVRVSEPIIDMGTDNSFMFLVGKTLDIPLFSRITIESDDNIFNVSPAEYETLEYRRMQRFSGYLGIKVENYGDVFEPFSLEFLKVSPKYPKIKD